LRFVIQNVVDHAKTAALPLASCVVLKPQLSKTAGSRNQIALLGLREQSELQANWAD
jgi:hypothetical protein